MNDNRKAKAPDREPLLDEERRLLEHIRSIRFGEVKIVVNNGKPVRIEEIRKSIKLQE